ncbi:MAG TPA: hypothetical protein VM009_03205 [Terriglobales bacterium]|nr:hypothetical protein [Terriglobales bacterium]
MYTRIFALFLLLSSLASAQLAQESYKLLATGRTSTMEKEINEMAASGYRFAGTMGGQMQGGEIVTIMSRTPLVEGKGRYMYRLLATNRTSTMQKELQEMSDAGYEFVGETARGEVIIIMELDVANKDRKRYDYKLLATSRTSTMQQELNEAVAQGYEFLCVLRRNEIISLLRRPRAR